MEFPPNINEPIFVNNYSENEIMTSLRKYLRPKKNFKRIKAKINTSQTDENNIDNMDKAQLDHSDNYVDITEYTRNNIKIPESEVQKSNEIINYINSNNRQSAADRETMIENILGQTMLQKKTKRGRRHKRPKQTKIKISEIQQDIIIEATEEQK